MDPIRIALFDNIVHAQTVFLFSGRIFHGYLAGSSLCSLLGKEVSMMACQSFPYSVSLIPKFAQNKPNFSSFGVPARSIDENLKKKKKFHEFLWVKLFQRSAEIC